MVELDSFPSLQRHLGASRGDDGPLIFLCFDGGATEPIARLHVVGDTTVANPLVGEQNNTLSNK